MFVPEMPPHSSCTLGSQGRQYRIEKCAKDLCVKLAPLLSISYETKISCLAYLNLGFSSVNGDKNLFLIHLTKLLVRIK